MVFAQGSWLELEMDTEILKENDRNYSLAKDFAGHSWIAYHVASRRPIACGSDHLLLP